MPVKKSSLHARDCLSGIGEYLWHVSAAIVPSNKAVCGATQVIVRASTFPAAVQKMQRALYEFVVRGVKTNVPFLANVLRHPAFLSGQVSPSQG